MVGFVVIGRSVGNALEGESVGENDISGDMVGCATDGRKLGSVYEGNNDGTIVGSSVDGVIVGCIELGDLLG